MVPCPLAIAQNNMTQERNRTAPSLSLTDLEAEVICLFVQISRIMAHPCKIYNILAVGAPVLYIGPHPSHVSEIPFSANGEGRCFSAGHGEVEVVVQQILRARDETQQRSRHSSPPVHSLFSKESVLPKLIAELESA